MRELAGRVRQEWSGVLGGGFLLLLALVTIVVPLLLHNPDPNAITYALLLPPGANGHVLGTDHLGRDELLRMIYGVRISFLVGVSAALVATIVGGVLGAASGFFGGAADVGLMRVSEFFQIMPAFILAAVIVALEGTSELNVILIIALLTWPQAARVMRGEVMRVKQLDYVDAVRCLGIGEWKILLREVIPNALVPVIALVPLIVAQAILLEAALSFLGLGNPDVVSWGSLLNDGQQYLFQAWWLSLFPGLAILLTVVAFNLLGDTINDLWSPRALPTRARRRSRLPAA